MIISSTTFDQQKIWKIMEQIHLLKYNLNETNLTAAKS